MAQQPHCASYQSTISHTLNPHLLSVTNMPVENKDGNYIVEDGKYIVEGGVENKDGKYPRRKVVYTENGAYYHPLGMVTIGDRTHFFNNIFIQFELTFD